MAQRFARDRVAIRELAIEVNRRPSTIRRLLNEAGVHTEDGSCVGVAQSEIPAALAARYREGVAIETLSHDTGIDRRVVRRLLIQAGVALRTRNPLSPEEADWIVEQYRAGASLRTLVELTGCSVSTIRRALLLAGITLRSPGTRSPRPRSGSMYGRSDSSLSPRVGGRAED